jgi:dephospho-CoA kinase
MDCLGLTGGIGMGKSTVTEMLRQRGWPVADSDLIARQVVEPGQPALAEIAARFGSELIGPDGRLRRDQLAQRVFSHTSLRRELEAILHPRIRQVWRAQLEQWRREGQPRAAVVVPLLYEVDVAGDFDPVWCVACAPATQQERLAGRRWTEAQIRQRNLAQWPIEKKMALADFVLWSEGGLEVLAAQVDRALGQGPRGARERALPPHPGPLPQGEGRPSTGP